MHRVTVGVNLPVGVGCGKFRGQRQHILRLGQGIIVAVQTQNPGAYPVADGIGRCTEHAVKADDTTDITARTSQIQHTLPAKTVTHGSDLDGIHLSLLAQGDNSRANAILQQLTVLQEGRHQAGIFLGATAQHALAVHIDGESSIAQVCQLHRLIFLEPAPATPSVGNRHPRPWGSAAIVPGQKTLQHHIIVLVFD